MRSSSILIFSVVAGGSLSCDSPSQPEDMLVMRQGSSWTVHGKIGQPVNLSSAVRALDGVRTLKYIVVSPSSRASEVNLGGDVGVECKEAGDATLWMFYQLTDAPPNDVWSLSCSHSQGAGG